MSSQKKISLHLIIFLFLVAFFVRCHGTRIGEIAIDKKRWLNSTISIGPETLDWGVCKESWCFQPILLMMEGLTRVDRLGGKTVVTPQLAERWESQGNALLFYIRKARWTDGEWLTSQHFVNAWKRLLIEKGPYHSFLFPIQNAQGFAEGRVPFEAVGVEAKNSNLLVVRLHAPSPLFLTRLAHPATWPVRSDIFNVQGPTLGKFRLDRWLPGREVVLSRNEKYHGGLAKIAGVRMSVVPSPVMRVQLFTSNETDFVDDVGIAGFSQLAKHPNLRIEETGHHVVVVFNTAKRPFNLQEMRLAFQRATNRDEFKYLVPWPIVSMGDYWPSRGENTLAASMKFDPVTAVGILTRLKFDSIGMRFQEIDSGLPFGRPSLSWNGLEHGLEVAENLRAQWIKNLGLKVDLVDVEPVKAAAATHSVFLLDAKMDVFDPLAVFERIASLAQLKASRWDNLLAGAKSAKTLEELMASIRKIQNYFVEEERVMMPLFIRGRAVLRRAGIGDTPYTILEAWDFGPVTLH